MSKHRIGTGEDAYRPAVGIMLLNAAGRIFVGQRIDTPGAWQMPQGGIDEGEEPHHAARRELKEETGIDQAELLAETAGWHRYELPEELHGKVWGGRYRGQRQKWFAMRFTGRDTDVDLATDHPEFDAWKWARAQELPDLIVPFKRQLYIDVLDELGPQCGLTPRR